MLSFYLFVNGHSRFPQFYVHFCTTTFQISYSAQPNVPTQLKYNVYVLQNFETPLHFASKYGHIECVSMLARHPLTKLDPRNLAGHTPVDLAATRLTSQEKIPHSDFDCPTNIVNRILQIFDERYN